MAVAPPAPAVPTPAEVAQVRAFNRFYTNVIGVLHSMYLGTPHTLTESRLLFEIAQRPAVEVSWLRRALDIDAGYLSRVLSRFEAEGLVGRQRSAADARRQQIQITSAGRAAVAGLDAGAATQIGALLDGVDRARLLGAMRTITEILGRSPSASPAEPGASPDEPGERAVTIRPLGPGDLGWILQRHGTLYAAEFGWDASFEDLCAQIIDEYVTWRATRPDRTAGWIAEVDGVPAGSVCCVPDGATSDAGHPGAGHPGAGPTRAGHPGAGPTARLRLLIAEPWARGLGLGPRLVAQCLDFARTAGYADIVLMTYDCLAAARRVYQAAGFTLADEHPETAFGHQLTAQTWSRTVPSHRA